MKRRSFIRHSATAGLIAVASGNIRFAGANTGARVKGGSDRIIKTDEEWKNILTENQYKVLFQEATEPKWSSSLNDERREGTYICAACNQPIFESGAKFDSGTGWPSFYKAISNSVSTREDTIFWIFTFLEFHCARCGGHHGHIFDDGPDPTGQRWCSNGVALMFVPLEESLPALRT